jgi:hypothetical protein
LTAAVCQAARWDHATFTRNFVLSSAAFLERFPQRFGAQFEGSDDSVLGIFIVCVAAN